MAASTESINLTLQLNAGADTDADELDLLARQFLAELQELPVESADLIESGAPPKGTKGGGSVRLGYLSVVVSPAAAPQVVGLLQSWSTRAESRSVKIQAQAGARSLELDYSPDSMSVNELKGFVKSLTA